MSTKFNFVKVKNHEGIYTAELKPEYKIRGTLQDGEGDYRISFKISIDDNTKKYKYYKYLNVTKEMGVKNLQDAIDARNQAIKNVKKGKNPFFKPKALSLDKAVDMYLENRTSSNNKKDKQVYDKHIKYAIGGIWVQKIKISDFQLVVDSMEKDKFAYDTITRTLVTPISALKCKPVQEYKPNQLDFRELEYKNTQKGKIPLDERISTDLKILANTIFEKILSVEDDEKRLYFLITFMCVRRTGEVVLIRIDDIDFLDNTINARVDTTKSGIRDMYPIPDEISKLALKHVSKYKLKSADLVFKYKQRAYSDLFKKLINELIKENKIQTKTLYKEQEYRQHDNRTLLATVMNEKYSEDFIGKNVLSHKNASSIDRKYSTAILKFKRKILGEYWDLLRAVDIIEVFQNPAKYIETYYDGDKNSLKTEKDGQTVFGYYKNTKLMFKVEIDEEDKPLKGVWYDENGKENVCTNASYKKFGFSK